MIIKIKIDEKEISKEVENHIVNTYKYNRREILRAILLDMMKKYIPEKEAKELFKHAVVEYMEKYKIKDILKLSKEAEKEIKELKGEIE